MKKIALFASGSGTNVEKIIEYFESKSIVHQYLILANNPNAKVIEKAEKRNIPAIIFDRNMFNEGKVEQILEEFNPDLIVLAGFLWKFPQNLVLQYPNKIINIHPSLLPLYGGKGMYGHNVHQAVLQNNDNYSGITIHYVNEHYDQGGIILQKQTDVSTCESWEQIAKKVQVLEHQYFGQVINKLLYDN